MKKIKITRRLNLHCETLRSLQLEEVTGGILSKPQASCFIRCAPTAVACTQNTCGNESANC